MDDRTFRFTEKKLAGLPTPPNGVRQTYRDTDVKGLELRVTDTGTKTFSWYRRVKQGEPGRVTIGRFPDVTVIQAREEATKYNALRVAGASPVAERKAQQRAGMVFSQLFDTYLDRHAKVHKKTWKEDLQRYEQYLAGPLGRVRIAAINREDLAKIHARITKSGHPAVANRVLALASSVFGRAIEWSILELNPVKGIRRNREESRDRFLGGDEMPRFMAALLAEPNDTLRDFFLLLLLTGARRTNVLSMGWADLSLDGANWRIPDTKSGDPLNVPLIPEAVSVLRRRRASDPSGQFVLPGPGIKGHLVEPKKAWQRIFDRDELSQIVIKIEAAGAVFELRPEAGSEKQSGRALELNLADAKAKAEELDLDISDCRLRETRIHDLRRTQGSWQAMTGASLQVIGKGLGHKNIATTSIYARLQTDPVRDAMTKATEAMLKGVDLSAGLSGSKTR